jgi:hypothetical protein
MYTKSGQVNVQAQAKGQQQIPETASSTAIKIKSRKHSAKSDMIEGKKCEHCIEQDENFYSTTSSGLTDSASASIIAAEAHHVTFITTSAQSIKGLVHVYIIVYWCNLANRWVV